MSGRASHEAWGWPAEQENVPHEQGAAAEARKAAQPRRVLQDVSNKQRPAPAGSASASAAANGPIKTEECRALKRRASDASDADKRPRLNFIRRIRLVEAAPTVLSYDDSSDDVDDDREPQMCAEYVDDIYSWLYKLQEQYMVDPAYIELLPPSVKWKKNRSLLVNWMILLHARFYMVPETLYLAVSLVDRLLAATPLPLDQLQLLGASAMFLAAKYEEVATPSIQNYAVACNSDDAGVRDMEHRLLVTLDFRLGYPSPLNFLRRISKADDYDLPTRTVGKFLLEISLVETRLMAFRPSDVAAAAMLVARYVLGLDSWDSNFVYYSGGCTAGALRPIVLIMREYLSGPCERTDEELIRKYGAKKYMRASSRATQWARTQALPPSPPPPAD